MSKEKHDLMLMEILEDQKTITGFLDSIFGFLGRRTDFYHESKSEIDKIGFPPGVRKGIVLKMMEKNDSSNTILLNEDSIMHTEVVTEIESPKKPKIMQKQKFQPSEYYNGAKHENYCWSQTNSEVEIHILLPESIKSSKQIDLKILNDSIVLKEKNNPANIMFQGTLSQKCRHSEAVWSLEGKKLQIAIDKISPTWWDRLLTKEPSINTNKINCDIPLEEYPEKTQSELERLQWDNQQKMMGLPTSEQIQNLERLKRAWDAEGSPFKGQTFDPSVVNLSNN